MRRVTEVDSDPGTINPLVVRMLRLQNILKHIDRRTKRMKVAEVGFNFSAQEL